MKPNRPLFLQGTLQYQLSNVHEELVPFGFLYSPERIVGARRSSNTSRNGQSVATRVTYDNEETKADVIKAAKAGQIWDLRERKVEGKWFKEPSYPKKRKKRPEEIQDQGEPESKKARKDSGPDHNTKLNEAEEAEEENKTQKFVERELEIEVVTQQIQDETVSVSGILLTMPTGDWSSQIESLSIGSILDHGQVRRMIFDNFFNLVMEVN